MDLVWIKVLLAAVVIAVALLGAQLALKAGASRRGAWYLTLGNAAAGGIFLGAALIHLSVDSAEHLAQVTQGDFNWAALLTGLGFLLVMVPERVAFAGRSQHGGSAGGAPDGFAGVVLTAVLSLHSVVAGLSLGLEQELDSFLGVTIAILAHKGTAAFALASVLQRSGLSHRSMLRALGIFSVMTPAGIVLGALLSGEAEGRSALLAEGIFDGIAAGTFLYIAALEIIDEVFDGSRGAWAKYALLVAGFGSMALLSLWV